MQRTRLVLLTGLAAMLALTPVISGQEAARQPAHIRVLVPADAVVEIDGTATKQTGASRLFVSPALVPGKTYSYTIKATWTDASGKSVSDEQAVKVRAGEESVVDLRPAVVKTPRKPDVPYVPTPPEIVVEMLQMADVNDEDVIYDLGCGDGRIPIAGAKNYRAKGVGIDIDPKRVEEAKENVKKAGVEKLVEIREGDMFNVKDLDQATVVTLYLQPDANRKLRPILQKKCLPTTKIISHNYDMGDWRPVQRKEVEDKAGNKHTLYLWIVGAENKGPIGTEEPKGKDVPKDKRPKLDVPYVPTPNAVVDKMLEMAKVGKDDVVYDLGCGDGRIVVAAAKKYNCKAVGVDLDPKRVKESLANVKKAGVENLVEIREGDALKVPDLGKATVVTLYLLEELNLKLKPILEKELKPGARIVTHDFTLGDDWKPSKEFEMKAKDDDGEEEVHTVYLYEIDKVRKAKSSLDRTGHSLVAALAAQDKDKKKEEDKEPDVIYVPTPQGTVDKMLELAKLKKDDIVYDLGCGDARIPVTAAKKYGCKAWGFDVDPDRIKDSNANVKKNDVGKLVTIEKKDIFTLDLSKANVVTLYLLPELNVKLLPQLKKMNKGSRIVTHDFDIEGIVPDMKLEYKAKKDNGDEKTSTIYLYTIPLKEEKK